MLLPRLWRPLPLRYSARAASELCASAPGPPVCVGLCSCPRACGSGRSASQAPGMVVRPGGGLRSEALYGPLTSPPASLAHGVHHTFSDLAPFVFRDPRPVRPAWTSPAMTACPPSSTLVTYWCWTTTVCLPFERSLCRVSIPC
jgi:hypothetical protein